MLYNSLDLIGVGINNRNKPQKNTTGSGLFASELSIQVFYRKIYRPGSCIAIILRQNCLIGCQQQRNNSCFIGELLLSLPPPVGRVYLGVNTAAIVIILPDWRVYKIVCKRWIANQKSNCF